MNKRLFDPKEWRRHGRGKERQFLATSENVARWLAVALPDLFGPYSLIGVETRRIDKKHYCKIPFIEDIGAFQQVVEIPGRHNLCIWSRSLTPFLEPMKEYDDAVWSLNGLIDIQHNALLTDGRWDGSRIAIVDRIINDQTGAIVTHKEYLTVFKTLKKEIKKDLKYTSVAEGRDGVCFEDKLDLLMTEDAYSLAKSGRKRYIHKPGNPL